MTIFDHLKAAPSGGLITSTIKQYFALPNLYTEDLGGMDLD